MCNLMLNLPQSLFVGLFLVHSSTQLTTKTSWHQCCASVKVSLSKQLYLDQHLDFNPFQYKCRLNAQTVMGTTSGELMINPMIHIVALHGITGDHLIKPDYINSTQLQGTEPSCKQCSSIFVPNWRRLADWHNHMPWNCLAEVPKRKSTKNLFFQERRKCIVPWVHTRLDLQRLQLCRC